MCDVDTALLPPASFATVDKATLHRVRIGTMTIIALCDGHFPLVAHDVLRSGPASLDSLLSQARLTDVVPSHVNAFLIDDGEHRVLVDAGAGSLQDATLGRMNVHLAEAGYGVDDIDTILLTHLHPDHMGGITRNGEAVFPKAVVHVPRDEATFWLKEGGLGEVDESVRATFDHARHTLSPYIEAGRYRTFDPGTCWFDMLTAESLPGHTCGHTGYRLRTDVADVVFCGDLFHVAAVQLATPAVTVCYDSAPGQARATRESFLAQAHHRGDIVAAAHAPFPGLGTIHGTTSGYAWHPLGTL